jgi:hypothetical protein
MTRFIPFHASSSVTAAISRLLSRKQPSSPRVFKAKKQCSLHLASTNEHAAMGNEAQRPPKQRVNGQHIDFSRAQYDITLSEPSSEETVTVIVGEHPHTATFHLPRAPLRETSEFLKRALRPEWGALSKRTVHLRDTQPVLFDLYARWLISGAEIMVEEHDWRLSYERYLMWRQHVEQSGSDSLCPETVWDFDISTEAWFLGDFLQSRDFQNHCLGHLYYMHLRFDHLDWEGEEVNQPVEGIWHEGTLAYVCLEDVLYTWEMTKHMAPDTPFRPERHPLRKFFGHWLERYWDAYELPNWDYEVQDGVVQVIGQCPDLVFRQLKALSWTNDTIEPIGAYWVDEDAYSRTLQHRIRKYPETHSCAGWRPYM